MQPGKPLTAEDLAKWRARRPNREVHVLTPPKPPPSDPTGEVEGETVVWEKPAPSFIRSGSAVSVYLKTVAMLRQGWDARVALMKTVPGVSVNIPDVERDRWIREQAEASNRRVYANVRPVRADAAVIVRADGDA